MKPLVAALAVLSATAAGASFHPVEDRPYRYDTVEIRTTEGVVRQFHTARTVVFHRTPLGYEAVVTLDAVDQHAGADVGRMFLAATGALLHRPLRYRLGADGTVIDVVDSDAAIMLIADAVEKMSLGDRSRRSDSRTLASPLRALSARDKVAMLGSIVAPLIAGPAADQTPGTRSVSLPSRPPLAPGTALRGIETVSRDAAGTVTIDLRASGGIDAPAPRGAPGTTAAKPTQAPVATLRGTRTIDPATGLIRDSREVREATMFDGDAVERLRIDTAITLTLAAGP